MHRLLNRNVVNYFAALIVLLAAATAYQLAAARWLRPPIVDIVEPRPPTETPVLRAGLADLFPDDAWQRGDCKRLLTKNGALLFQNWKQTSEDQWTLWPITLVLGRGLSSQGTKNPIVLTAVEGAEVQFAQSLDMMEGSAPPIKMGRMIGDVLIQRAGELTAQDRLTVTTRNVRIDNQKLWTTEQIQMQVGNSRLTGRNLTIHLASGATSAVHADSAAAILDRMELVYLQEFRIPLEPTPSKEPLPRRIGTATSQFPIAKSAPRDNGEVAISCDNGLIYDFALDRLSLREAISLTRTIAGEIVDRFDCETLDLSLRDPANQKMLRDGPLDWLERIYATGAPATLRLNSYDMDLSAETIEFDSIAGLLRADGSRGVQLRRGLIQGHLSKLTYQYDPQQPTAIGSLDALGGGVVTVKDPASPIQQFRWTKAFQLQPLSPTLIDDVRNETKDAKLGLRIDGNVSATLANNGTFAAGAIEGVLKTIRTQEPTGRLISQVGADGIRTPAEETGTKISMLPEVLHATDQVALDSSEVMINTQQLSLFFEAAVDLLNPRSSQPRNDQNKAQRLLLQNGNIAGRTPPVSQQGRVIQPQGFLSMWTGGKDPNTNGSDDSLRIPVARARPSLAGDTISAQLLITPDGMQAKDVSVQGNVNIRHQYSSGTTVMPINLIGETMRFQRSAVSQGNGRDHLQLGSGPHSPARLTMGDGFFVGPMIKIWPSENAVQVEGAGELKIPTVLLAPKKDTSDTSPTAQSTGSAALAKIDWTSPPHCHWSGGLQFDGQYAQVTGGIEINAELISNEQPWTIAMKGDAMEIALSNRIELTDRVSFASAQIKQVSLIQQGQTPVVVQGEQFSSGTGPASQFTEARHLITAKSLVLNPNRGGELIASGPGWYRGWSMMDQKQSLLSNKAAKSENLGNQVLQGVHLTFRDAMRADMAGESLTFTGGVRTGVRKLLSWEDAVDVNQMERLAVGEMTMDCSQLQFGITPGIPEHLRNAQGMSLPWQMAADGGVVLRTNTDTGMIDGTADRATFESQKSWLVISSSPRKSAFIRKRDPDGKVVFQSNVPGITINTKTYEAEATIDDAQLNDAPALLNRQQQRAGR